MTFGRSCRATLLGAVRADKWLKLNQSVCRERHILPLVEQILAQLGGAAVFSKLDVNSGFWQIELTERLCCPDNLHYYPLWKVLLQSPSIWNHIGSKTLSTTEFRFCKGLMV